MIFNTQGSYFNYTAKLNSRKYVMISKPRTLITANFITASYSNCLLTDLAYPHMTCHKYNGHAARTDRTDTDSKMCRVCFSECSVLELPLYQLGVLSRRKFFLIRRSDLGFAILQLCPLVSFGDSSSLICRVFISPDTCFF